MLDEIGPTLLEEIANERKIRETSPEEVLTQRTNLYRDDPLGYVQWAYPWGQKGPLERFSGPDVWQAAFLTDLGVEVRKRAFDGRTAVAPIRMTVSSGHGIGKGTMAGWLTSWIMSTRPHSQGTVTANTFPQLETKTWAAIQRWVRMSRTSYQFTISGGGIYHRQHREDWKCTPQSCREENSESFAGQHAATSTSFYIFDESSAIAEMIWEVAEGGLSDGEPMIFAFGNSTRSGGKFHRINFGEDRKRWNHRTVDSRTCMMPNKTQIEEWVHDYGEDSDFVRVRVKGLPPNASDMQYIDSERVYTAQRRAFEVFDDEPLVAGVDLARGGGDKAVIRFRRGADARTIKPIKIPGESVRDSTLLISKLTDLMVREFDIGAGKKRKVDFWFLDGTGLGGPIIDRLAQLGHKNIAEVQFGAQCPDPRHYANMRAWMWSKMRDALGSNLAIDEDRELEIDLTSVGLGKPDKMDRIVLESKQDMKKRGLGSPDDGDSLALTWAMPIKPKPQVKAVVSRNILSNAGEHDWMAS